jgi:hypothetical protein
VTVKDVICGSCHAPAVSFGKSKKNDKGQFLINIKPHWKAGQVGGMVCNARIGIAPK